MNKDSKEDLKTMFVINSNKETALSERTADFHTLKVKTIKEEMTKVEIITITEIEETDKTEEETDKIEEVIEEVIEMKEVTTRNLVTNSKTETAPMETNANSHTTVKAKREEMKDKTRIKVEKEDSKEVETEEEKEEE